MTKTILIAEDEPSLSSVLTQKLTSLGYRVEVAADGQEVMSKLEREQPDLLLLDVIMPKKNGLAVLEDLRVGMGSKIPVIVLSNLEREADIEASKAYDVEAYIIKAHVSLHDLIQRISQTLVKA